MTQLVADYPSFARFKNGFYCPDCGCVTEHVKSNHRNVCSVCKKAGGIALIASNYRCFSSEEKLAFMEKQDIEEIIRGQVLHGELLVLFSVCSDSKNLRVRRHLATRYRILRRRFFRAKSKGAD